ncbi:MAG: hypothetical protein PF541_09955 [Prolixibacteraceae bacterium]|jgi:hypothetical protein|nr:hypothetical protein [Prolixibacteraceae bacterium]
MRKLFIIVSMLFVVVVVKAQDSMFLKGDKVVTIGVGLGYYPLVSASVDYCIADDIADLGSIGVGPYVGLGFRWHSKLAMAGVRGTFHYPIIENLDTYAGVAMGLKYYMYSNSIYNEPDIDPRLFLGARYQLNDAFTLFLEAGYGSSNLTAGIAITL